MRTRLNGNRVSGVALKQTSVGQQHSDIETIGDMLRAGENVSGRAEVVYTADMSYPEVQKYLDYLMNKGFINKVNLDKAMVVYQVTESGLKFLKAIDMLLDMTESTRDAD